VNHVMVKVRVMASDGGRRRTVRGCHCCRVGRSANALRGHPGPSTTSIADSTTQVQNRTVTGQRLAFRAARKRCAGASTIENPTTFITLYDPHLLRPLWSNDFPQARQRVAAHREGRSAEPYSRSASGTVGGVDRVSTAYVTPCPMKSDPATLQLPSVKETRQNDQPFLSSTHVILHEDSAVCSVIAVNRATTRLGCGGRHRDGAWIHAVALGDRGL